MLLFIRFCRDAFKIMICLQPQQWLCIWDWRERKRIGSWSCGVSFGNGAVGGGSNSNSNT